MWPKMTYVLIEASSLDVELALFDPDYDPTYDLEASCPMCRNYTNATPDEALAAHLKTKYPSLYEERRVEEEVERGSRSGTDGIEGIMILIGNKHQLVEEADDANEHDWTFFVRTSRPDLVKHLTLRKPPYEVRRLGWGHFTLEAEIVLKEPYSWVVNDSGSRQAGLELSWALNFEGGGRQGRVRAKVKKFHEDTPPANGRRVLRSGRMATNAPVRVDDDEDDDADYDDDESDEDETSSEEEEISEFLDTP
ncbi:hypothetical protein SNOG_06011 [Parastagonospora nodorum SN15]|uniref:YEATS domain-containing protein n=1 Tax=Phaeosphaeria nodorum (strain SN15 / ATCC MYA-4574 / FGSC 10173) TaxID=321614 RepID=Q0UQF3_PHANO|nr:hypothetical protein SNOG_06011 [Parastagonospora nodorum SN15]EAT87075.2 hypothetical protein SNOG_06011 [Parastagonospora nodorum SN15]